MIKYTKLIVLISLFLTSINTLAHDAPLLSGYVKNTTVLLEAEGDLSPVVDVGRNTRVWMHFSIKKPPNHRYGVFEVVQRSMKHTSEKRASIGGAFYLNGIDYITGTGYVTNNNNSWNFLKLTKGTTEYAYLSIMLLDSANNQVDVYYKSITGGSYVRSELGNVVYSAYSDPEGPTYYAP